MRNSTSIFGFTLVELLITLAVLGTSLGVGTVSYVSFNERQVVEQVARNLVSDLRVAQQRGLTGIKDIDPTTGCGPEDLLGWCFSGDYDGENMSEYSLYGSCGDGVSAPITFPQSDQQDNRQLPDGVTIQSHVVDPSGNYSSDLGGRVLFSAGSNETRIMAPDLVNGGFLEFDHIVYCVTSDFPSLALGDNVYRIEVTNSGEIIEGVDGTGFVDASECPGTP